MTQPSSGGGGGAGYDISGAVSSSVGLNPIASFGSVYGGGSSGGGKNKDLWAYAAIAGAVMLVLAIGFLIWRKK